VKPLKLAVVSSFCWRRSVWPASAVATRADAPEPRSFDPYAFAAAAIKGFSPRHPSRVNTIRVVSTARITGPEIAARRTSYPRFVRPCPAAPLRVATADACRTARARGRGGAGRPPPSEHTDITTAGRRARRGYRVDEIHRLMLEARVLGEHAELRVGDLDEGLARERAREREREKESRMIMA
jgi:hypothetical protein